MTRSRAIGLLINTGLLGNKNHIFTPLLSVLIPTTTYFYLCQEGTDGELVYCTAVADAEIKAETARMEETDPRTHCPQR